MVEVPAPSTKTEDIPGSEKLEYMFTEGPINESIPLTGTVPAGKTWNVVVKIVVTEA